MKRRSLRFNIVLLAVSIILSIIIGMVLLLTLDVFVFKLARNELWFDPNTEFDPELGWRQIPNRFVYMTSENITSNSLGGRGEEVDYSKEHILVMGDSVVLGFAVDDKQTMPYYLEGLIDGKYPGLQVLNMGVSGYGIDQYYLSLNKRINLTNPRLVIVVIYTRNDFEDTSSDNAYGRSKPFLMIRNNQLVNLNPKISRYSCHNLLTDSKILRLTDRKGQLRNHLCDGRQHSRNETEEIIKRLLSEVERIADEHGSRLLFVLDPGMREFENESVNQRFFRELFRNSDYSYLDYYAFLKSRDIDVSDLYQDDDPNHFTPSGNRLWAEAIFSYIEENRLLD